MSKHLRNNILFGFLFGFFFISACEEKEEPEKFVVKVGSSILTPKEFNYLLTESDTSNITKDKLLRIWIENELLYQEAIRDGLDETEQYIFSEKKNRKKILAGLYLEKYLSNQEIKISQNEIDDYFKNKSDDIILSYNIYKVNTIRIKNFDKAMELRNALNGNLNFISTVNKILKESDIIELKTAEYLKEIDIYTPELNGIIPTMLPGEVSYPIDYGENSYLIVQLIDKYIKGNQPTREFVKDLIIERIKIQKQKDIIRNLIANLSEKTRIEFNEEKK